MDFQYLLDISAAKGGSNGGATAGGSKSGPKPPAVVIVTNGSGGWGAIPLFARILILVFTILVVIWIVAFIFFLAKEFGRKRASKSFRLGHALWSATKVATGLWFVIWLYKTCTGKGKGKYSKIDEAGHGRMVNNTSIARNGAPATAAYAVGGTGYNGAGTGAKYEPMGYTAPYAAPSRGGPPMTENQPPAASMAPSPMSTPVPQAAGFAIPPISVSPPGYTAPQFQPQLVDQKAAYNMPTHPLQAAAAHPSQSPSPSPSPSYHSTAPPAPSPPLNSPQASATYIPSQSNYMPQY